MFRDSGALAKRVAHYLALAERGKEMRLKELVGAALDLAAGDNDLEAETFLHVVYAAL